MAYSQFMTARNSFENLGDSLASIQQSVGQQSVDDEFQNQQTNSFFDSVKQQVLDTGLMETVASVPTVVMGVKGLYGTLSGLKGKIVQAGQDAKDLLTGKLAEAKDVLSGGVSDIRDTIGEGISGIRATATSAAERAGSTISEGVASASDVISGAAAGIRGTAGELGTEMSEFRTFARRPVSSYATEEIDTGAEASLPSLSEAGSGVMSSVSDFLTGGIRNTLQSAGNAQEMILDSDPEALGAGARGYFFGVGSEAQGLAQSGVDTARGVLSSGVDTARGVLSSGVDTARGVLSGAADVAETAGRGLMQGAAETGGVLAQQGSELIGGLGESALGTAAQVAEGATSTFGRLAGIGSDVVSGLTGIGADLAVPVLGEVALVGSAVYGVVKGFEDLFHSPKAPTPIMPPQISVANISQSFQSGI